MLRATDTQRERPVEWRALADNDLNAWTDTSRIQVAEQLVVLVAHTDDASAPAGRDVGE